MQNEADKDNEGRRSITKEERAEKINWAATGSARLDEWAQKPRDFSFLMKIPAIHFNLLRTMQSTRHLASPSSTPTH